MTKNPWLALLALPLAHRPFLAGTLNVMQQAKKITVNDADASGLTLAITMKDALEYAKQVNEVPLVGNNMLAYNNLRQQ